MNEPIEVEVVEIEDKDVLPKSSSKSFSQSTSSPQAEAAAPFSWQKMVWRDLKGKVPWSNLLRRMPVWGWVLLPFALIALTSVAALFCLGLLLRLLLRGLNALLR